LIEVRPHESAVFAAQNREEFTGDAVLIRKEALCRIRSTARTGAQGNCSMPSSAASFSGSISSAR
jgi:hypothetical protein